MTSQALDGFVVAVTADRRASEQIELLRRHGARTIHGPTMQTLPIVADGALRDTTASVLRNPPAIVLANTGIGMRAWLSAADSWGLGEDLAEALRGVEVVARGPKAAGSLVTVGCDVRWKAMSGRLSEVVDHLLQRDLSGVRILCQRDGSATDPAAAALRAAGADVVELGVYKWLRPEDETAAGRLLDAICDRSVDAVTFTSRPAIENLFALAEERNQGAQLLSACAAHVVPVCVGPVCFDAAVEHGLTAAVAPSRWFLGAMVNTLVDVLQDRRLSTGRLTLAGLVATVDGRRLELSPREAAVLRVLAARRGVVISKQTLLKEVWGDPQTDEHALEMVISRLRRQLGPASASIKTVLRRGYVLQ